MKAWNICVSEGMRRRTRLQGVSCARLAPHLRVVKDADELGELGVCCDVAIDVELGYEARDWQRREGDVEGAQGVFGRRRAGSSGRFASGSGSRRLCWMRCSRLGGSSQSPGGRLLSRARRCRKGRRGSRDGAEQGGPASCACDDAVHVAGGGLG